MDTKRNKLNRSLIPLFALAVVTLVVLSLILVPAGIGATAGLAASSQRGGGMVTFRQSGWTWEDVPLAGPGEWAQALVEISGAPDGAVVSYVQVKYSVVYPQPSDLEVKLLKSGSNVTHTLWDRGSAEGAELTQSAGEIAAFQGAPVNGTWSLAVKGGEQEGYIDGFSINVYYEADMPVPHQEGEGTPGQPGLLRLPEGAAPASPSQDEDEKPDVASEEGASVVPLDVPPGATIILAEDFDSREFPYAPWDVRDQSNDGRERYWDDAHCDACGGDWAVWPADGGANRVNVCSGANYPNNMYAWMVYPFDLSDASNAGTEFTLWRQIEANYDWVFFGVSANCRDFTGIFWDGSAGCQSWNITYSDWVGDPSVCVAWAFYSDGATTRKGPWVDDIVIWKTAGCTVRLDPPAKDVCVGSTFTFDVWIDDVVNLGGFQFDLDYDPATVRVNVSSPHNGADPGPFPGSTGRPVYEIGPTVNNPAGDMSYGVYTTGSNAGASGSGMLATIYFRARSQGTSTLDLSNLQVTDTAGNVISCEPQDGTVTVAPCDCAADVNNDSVIDIVDIMTVVGCWGKPCPCPP